MKSTGNSTVKTDGLLRSAAFTLIFVLLILSLPLASRAQVKIDSTLADTITVPRHSPRKATILSAVVPGLGQAYNRKYWKIPVIYAGLLTAGYFIYTNNKELRDFEKGYISLSNNDTLNDPFKGQYSSEELFNAVEYYRRNRDISIIIAVGIYAMNVIDAAVDAHLFYFDVSDNLTLRASPDTYLSFRRNEFYITPAITLSLSFKK